MESTTLDQALQLLGTLNHEAANILPPQGPDDHQQSSEASAAACTNFVQASAALQGVLEGLRHFKPANERDELLQEIQSLQAELDSKEQLLAHSGRKVEEWQQTCDQLKSLHESTFFKFTS